MIHPTANIWKSTIGEGTRIAAFVEIGGATVGRNCSIQAFAFVCPWVTLEDDVFIGPHVCFTNDKRPPSGGEYWKPTRVCRGASIGANATILPGVTIGERAVIGAGSVVTKDVPAGETWFGNPACRRS